MTDESPAERYAAFKARQRDEQSHLARYRAKLPYTLDDFQHRAASAVESGHTVLVAAPTGAGKTVIGEFACYLAATTATKAFYTTPIKALSNQKYEELCAVLGASKVGLLTGDQSLNADADIVVMTTEVLRNMLYANSPALARLRFVVMDEVHYLADRFRGGVWEEVILHVPSIVQIVALSATVSNAEEFGAWLQEVRGHTTIVISEERPIPLDHHVALSTTAGTRILPLYDDHTVMNPEVQVALRDAPTQGFGRGGRHFEPSRKNPSRGSVCRELSSRGYLPAIYFVFSRAGCDQSVDQLLRRGAVFTTPSEAITIRNIAMARTAILDDADRRALGWSTWITALEHGIAAHHAGMLPIFKQTVEELFTQGLIKVVFATETLALGINMPARSVVLDRLIKWDGSAHVALTAGEYTQLTGRAGRRGIDVEGHAIVVDHRGFDATQLAGLASRRTYPLRSRFTPTYNMVVNMVDRVGTAKTRDILTMSFAQFQADRAVVSLAQEAHTQATAIAGYEQSMRCEAGDITEYLAIADRLHRAERDHTRLTRTRATANMQSLWPTLRPGDVVWRHRQPVVIVHRVGQAFQVMTRQGRLKNLTMMDITHPGVITHIPVPARGWRGAKQRIITDLAAATSTLPTPEPARTNEQLTQIRDQLRRHPCHQCPERNTHLRWAKRLHKLHAEHAKVTANINHRTGSIVRDFDKIAHVLNQLGYLNGSPDTWHVTEEGRWLAQLYTENDVLIAEALHSGAWDDLSPEALAGVLVGVLYQGRGEDNIPPALRDTVEHTTKIWSTLNTLHASVALPPITPLDFTLTAAMWSWAQGHALTSVLTASDIAAGDFVRWCRYLIDVLQQLTTIATHPTLRRTAHDAIHAINRGVVALS